MLVACNCECCQRHRESLISPFNLGYPYPAKKSRFDDLDIGSIIDEFLKRWKEEAPVWPYAEDQATFDELL